MAYQTGTATSFANLATTIDTFCQAQGWTKSGTVLYKGSSYVEISSDTSNLYVLGGTGQSGGSLTGASSDEARMSTLLETISFPGNYYLFAHTSPDQITCILEHDSVWYQWVAFGDITKYGTWTGGNWFGGSMASTGVATNRRFTATDGYSFDTGNPSTEKQPSYAPWWRTHDDDVTKTPGNCLIYCDLDSAGWVSNSSSDSDAVYAAPILSPLVLYSRSQWNEQAVLVPPILAKVRPSSFRSIIGFSPHFRFLRVDNYAAGDIITIGTDEWKVFPFWKKDLDDTTPYTGNTGPYGWAIAYDGP